MGYYKDQVLYKFPLYFQQCALQEVRTAEHISTGIFASQFYENQYRNMMYQTVYIVGFCAV